MNTSDHVQMKRLEAKFLFLARHFAVFFNLACNHFAATFKESFDFVKMSRYQNPVLSDLSKHLSKFFLKIKFSYNLMEFALPMVASSFILDSYPPDMHGKPSFAPAKTQPLTPEQCSAWLTSLGHFIEKPAMRSVKCRCSHMKALLK